MIAFKDASELIRFALGLERKLKDFYDVAEVALRSEDSRRTVAALRERLEEKLAALSAMDLKRFGRGEFLKIVPELEEEDVVPRRGLDRDASSGQIVERILASEERLRRFYAEVAERLVAREQKDLFSSLVAFKDAQLADIRQLRLPPA
jgi:hypothetical protein